MYAEIYLWPDFLKKVNKIECNQELDAKIFTLTLTAVSYSKTNK